jgi:hypothetical protein
MDPIQINQTLMNAVRIRNTLVKRHLNETKAHSKHSFIHSDKYPALVSRAYTVPISTGQAENWTMDS